MGGKQRQAQRTKNNARPSSSGRSAELLGGFNGKEAGFKLPGFSLCPAAEDLDSALNPNLQLVLKKMNKKDATTKLKALQEFSEIIKTTDEESVKLVLLTWCRLYCTLATDVDPRVREAAHIGHHSIVIKAKRNLAPYLKQLSGPWFTSQYDTYAPAASAAEKSFQNAFPQNKVQEAIIFCQEEILTYIHNNLVVHTAQTLSNPKTTTPEDADAKYQRVLIASLQGYALYLSKVPSEQLENAVDLNNKIVTSAKFWKLSKHKIPSIRAGWFNVLTKLCQKRKFLLDKEGEHLTSAVMNNLDESEPMILPYIWECALLLNSTINEWWQYVNIEKVVLPKLWKILKEGGQGNASVIFPNLLPLISHFPPLANLNLFYKTYFDNMQIGLQYKTAVVSRSEASAIVTSFIECLRYIILKNEADVELCEQLIKNHLLQITEWSLVGKCIASKTLYAHICTLLQYWSRNRTSEEHPNYSVFLAMFWENVETIFTKVIKSSEFKHENDVIGEIASRQIELLLSLQRSGITSCKKQMKVKFFSTEALESGDIENDAAKDINADEFYLSEVKMLTHKTCFVYIETIQEKQCKELISHLYSLVLDFDSLSLFEYLNKMYDSGDSTGNLVNIYTKLLHNWISDSTFSSQPVVGLLFLLFNHLKDFEKDIVLESLLNINLGESWSWCIGKALAHPYCQDPKIQHWLSNEKVSEFLENIAKEQIEDTSTPEHTLLLKQAFTENSEGKLYVSKEACINIVKIFNVALLKPAEYPVTIDACASFAAYLAATLYTESTLLEYGDELLLALFQLSCDFSVDPETFSEDTLWEVNTAWQDALTTVVSELNEQSFKELIFKFTDVIYPKILSNDCDTAVFDRRATAVIDFLKVFIKKFDVENFSDVFEMFAHRPDCLNGWKCELLHTCIMTDIITGKMSSPWVVPVLDEAEFCTDNLVPYLLWLNFCISIVNRLEFESGNEAADDGNENDHDSVSENAEEEGDGSTSKLKYCTPVLYEMTLEVLVGCAIAKSVLDNFKNIDSYNEIEKQYNDILLKLKEITGNLNEAAIEELNDIIMHRAIEETWIFGKAFYIYHANVRNSELVNCYKNVVSHLEPHESLEHIHFTQLFAKDITFENIVTTENAEPIESLINLRAMVHCDSLEVPIAEACKFIDDLKRDHSECLLYETDVTKANWREIQYLVEIVRLEAALVESQHSYIQKKHWDFIILSTASWISSMAKSNVENLNIQTSSFIVATIRLYCAVFNHMKVLIKTAGLTHLVLEWMELFVEDVHVQILQTWIFLADKYMTDVPLPKLVLIQHFGKVTTHLNHDKIFESKSSMMPRGLMLVPFCCKLVTCSNHTLQLWGYHMLMGMISSLIKLDTLAVNTNVPQEDGFILEQFKEMLLQTEDVVHTMLIDFKLGDTSCRVQPFTDAYTYTFGYLCICNIILKLCGEASTELCFQYAEWLKNGNHLSKLLNNIFRLLPTEILHSESKCKSFGDYFAEEQPLDFDRMVSSELLEHLTCRVYVGCVEQLPALVRQWWSDIEHGIAQVVDRVTTIYVSPQLCYQELAYIGQCQTKFKNMTIKIHQSVREVVAIYTVDEAQMELVITLPANYPLGGPNVECIRQIGGTSCRQWLMQLKMCVLHQNGRIWDGLSLWNSNLNKKFEGVEECYICFAVLHHGTYQLPKLCCKTCRKKFHSACLYKWFSTSNKSTCPICRNLF